MPRRRPSIQVSIEAVLEAQNLLQEFKPGFHVRLYNDPFMPLEIRRGPTRISIAHTYEEDGHRWFDPRITFLYDWSPIEVRQDPVADHTVRGRRPQQPGAFQAARNDIGQGVGQEFEAPGLD